MSADDHGNRTTYINHKCRCDECKAANTQYMQEKRKEWAADTPFSQIPHGISGYMNFACRCETCVRAQSERLTAQRNAA